MNRELADLTESASRENTQTAASQIGLFAHPSWAQSSQDNHAGAQQPPPGYAGAWRASRDPNPRQHLPTEKPGKGGLIRTKLVHETAHSHSRARCFAPAPCPVVFASASGAMSAPRRSDKLAERAGLARLMH